MDYNPEEIEKIGEQLREVLQTEIAIIDKYGFILSSSIKGFEVNTVISPTLLKFMNDRETVAEELHTENIRSMVVSILGYNLVFSFGESLIIMAKLPDNIDLSQFLPSIHKFLSLMAMGTTDALKTDFVTFDVNNETEKMISELKKEGESYKNKFKIFQSIVKRISQLR